MAKKENVAVEETEVAEVKEETPVATTEVAEAAVADADTAVATEVASEEVAVSTDSGVKKDGAGAKVKEWFRKQVVKIKRKPHMIPFFFLLVSGIFYLLCLNAFSQTAAETLHTVRFFGLAVFVNVLFSILVLVLFLNAFPKHAIVNKKTGKKSYVNVLMLVLGFVFIAAMIACEIIYLNRLMYSIGSYESYFFKNMTEANQFSQYWSAEFAAKPELVSDQYCSYLLESYRYAIAHIVLLGVTAIVYATLPLYKKLIMKINTKKVIEDNNIKETIDTED